MPWKSWMTSALLGVEILIDLSLEINSNSYELKDVNLFSVCLVLCVNQVLNCIFL